MEWTEETIQRLRSLWQEGLSTAEIGRRMSITKNAVVGKAHRLVLPARPSPIRRVVRQSVGDGSRMAGSAMPSSHAVPAGGAPGSVMPFSPRPAMQPVSGPRLQADGEAPTNVTPLRRPPAAESQGAGNQGAAARSAGGTAAGSNDGLSGSRDADLDEPRVRREQASPSAFRSTAEPRLGRRSQSCCWPLGDPGTKQFHFCGGEPIPGKPYCVEHAQLAYVKLRDRRDTVA